MIDMNDKAEVCRYIAELQKRIAELEDAITERKQAQEEQNRSNEYFRLSFETADIAICLVDPDGRFTMVNEQMCTMYGYTKGELESMTIKDIIYPEDLDFGSRFIQRASSGEIDHQRFINRYKHKDGHIVWGEVFSSIVRDGHGNPICFISYVLDITEHRLTEEKLKESEEKFSKAFYNQSIAMQIVDLKTGERVDINESFVRLWGVKKEEFQQGNMYIDHSWVNAEAQKTGTVNLIKDGFINNYPMDLINKSGEIKSLLVNGTMLEIGDGNLAILSFVDITEFKKAAAALLRRERYLSGLNEASQVLLVPSDAVLFQEFVDKIGPALDASRTYVFINHHDPAGSLLMSQEAEWCAEGINPEIDNPLLQGLSYDGWFPRWKDILEHGDIINGPVHGFPAKEREVLEPQGILAILIIPIMLDGEFVGFIGFDNCVSDREWSAVEQTFLRAAASELAQAIKRVRSEERVRASLKEKEVLLREIHHRVKNNMQVIVSLLRMYSRRTDDMRLGQVFADCRDRVNAMSLIHEALYQSEDLARIDFEVYLKKLCSNLIQAHGASDKGIVVTVDRCNVALDMDQGIAVGMVICELVSNAFKHAFPLDKGGRLSVSLSSPEGEVVELIVQDDGKGLPPEIDILNPPLLGLRLAAATVTRELGGNIEVERNGGTRFIIRFKCKSK